MQEGTVLTSAEFLGSNEELLVPGGTDNKINHKGPSLDDICLNIITQHLNQ